MDPRKTASGYIAGMGLEGSPSTGVIPPDTIFGTPRRMVRLQYWQTGWAAPSCHMWTRKSPTFITALSCGSRHMLHVAAGINIYSFSFPVVFPFPLSCLSVCLKMSAHTHDSPSSTQNIVGIHYRVGKKIGEGSFVVIFEGPSPHPQLPESYLT